MAAILAGALHANKQLWGVTFWEVWDPIPLGEKLTWIALVGQTVGIITLLQILLLLKK
jgi:hypothetical protein